MQAQPESLTVSLDKSSLLVGSEGRRSRVYSIPIPRTETESPTPTESSIDPGPDPADPDDEAEPSSGRSRAGTLMALGLAGLVAGIAGTVVALIRKP